MFKITRWLNLTLDTHCNAHAAADTQGGQSLFCVPALHFMQQCYQYARARRADRVADGNGAAIDIDFFGVPAKALVDGTCLGGKGFIGLDEIKLFMCPSGEAGDV